MSGPIENLKSARSAPGVEPDAWARALAHTAWAVLKEDEHGWVGRGLVLVGKGPAQEVIVKVRRAGSIIDRVKSLVGKGRLARQWDGAQLLSEMGEASGRPLLLGSCTRAGETCELLVVEFVPGPTLLEVMAAVRSASAAPGLERALRPVLAELLALSLVRLVRAGFFNRDFKPSNIVVRGLASPPWHAKRVMGVAQIDTVAIRPCDGRWLYRAPVRMLTSLMLEAIGCDCAPSVRSRIALLGRVVDQWNDDGSDEELPREIRREGIRSLIKHVQARIDAHGDPTPRTNPLATPDAARARESDAQGHTRHAP